MKIITNIGVRKEQRAIEIEWRYDLFRKVDCAILALLNSLPRADDVRYTQYEYHPLYRWKAFQKHYGDLLQLFLCGQKELQAAVCQTYVCYALVLLVYVSNDISIIYHPSYHPGNRSVRYGCRPAKLAHGQDSVPIKNTGDA